MSYAAIIEPLEARIAPATLTGRVLTYTDLDGDKVTITFTKGTYALSDFTFSPPNGGGGPEQLLSMNFADVGDEDKAGTSITMKVTRAGMGDGVTNVGSILAMGMNLGDVTITGDLTQIRAGDGEVGAVGVKSLKVGSLGIYGLATVVGGSRISTVDGAIGLLQVKGDIYQAEINAESIGKVTVGGSLVGGVASYSGRIAVETKLGDVTIKGDIRGGTGAASGTLYSGGSIGKITLGSLLGSSGESGSLVEGSGSIVSRGDISSITINGRMEGGAGFASGSIRAGISSSANPKIGDIKIKGSMAGGAGDFSGMLFSEGTVKSLTVGGSIMGDAGDYNLGGAAQGQVYIMKTLGSVKVTGDVLGGSGTSGGRIYAKAGLGPVTIGGSMVAGPGVNDPALISDKAIGAVKIGGDVDGREGAGVTMQIAAGTNLAGVTIGGSMLNAQITAQDQLGAVVIKGSLTSASIVARGQEVQSAKADIAIKSVAIGGTVTGSRIMAGYDVGLVNSFVNPDAQIGAVTVGGDWRASDLVAGINHVDGVFGNSDDAMALGNENIVSRIASVVIKGAVIGTPSGTNASDSFAFLAQEIGALTVGGLKGPLKAGVVDAAFGLSVTTGYDVVVKEFGTVM